MFIAVVEDINEDQKKLCGYIEKYFKSNDLSYEIVCYKNAKEFIDEFKPDKFEIVFLDIYYSSDENQINGFQLSKKIRQIDQNIKLIFTTTSTDFGIESYSVFASDYILKPVTYERIELTFKKLEISSIEKNVITIISNRITETIKTDSIIYIAPNGRGNSVVTTNSTYFTNMTFDVLCEKLNNNPSFLCCKRGYTVNMNYISEVKGYEFVMKNGHTIPIRTRNSSAVKKEYSDFMFNTLWKE